MREGTELHPSDQITGTTFRKALAGGHDEIVAKIVMMNKEIASKVDLACSQDVLFGTPLQKAAVEGYDALAHFLLVHMRADPNVAGGCFGSAFQLAATERNKHMLQMLLEAPGGFTINSFGGAFQQTLSTGNRNILDLLLQVAKG